MIDKNTGMAIAPEYVSRLEVVAERLNKGLLIGPSDFVSAGIKENSISSALARLQGGFGLDILNIRRGHKLIGWILADEVL